MKPWEWLEVPEIWYQSAVAFMNAEHQMRPVLERREQARAQTSRPNGVVNEYPS